MKTILVTGAGGFIGNHFYNYLQNKPNIKIVGTTNKNRNKIRKNLIPKNLEKKKIFKCDLSKSKEVKILINKIKPDIIYHFAAMADHNISEKNKKSCKRNNSVITKNIISCINSDCRLIFLSSDKIYSANPKKSPEHTNLNPLGFLAKEKLKCEKIIIKKIKKYFILRLPIVHKRGESKNFSTIDNFLFLLKKKKEITVFKNIKRSFLKIDEFNIFLEKLISNKNFGIYNVGSKLFSYSSRLEILCKDYKINIKNNINKINGNIRPIIQNFKTKKLKKNFNFQFS
jgi:nucleoside-diphosphate-sugar epimerase